MNSFLKSCKQQVCKFSRNELHHGHFPANFLKTRTTFFILFQNWPRELFICVWLFKEPFFCLQCVLSSSANGNFKETFYLTCFCFYLHFEHFHTAAFFCHERLPQEYFHISCGTILRKLNKTS